MTCKYYDCGFCYAPKDVEHNSKNGSCIDPLSCPYNKENKTLMTEKEHLECEIEELKIEIEQKARAIGNLKGILERKEQQLKEMNDAHRKTNEAVENKRKEHLVSDLQSKNWYVNMREFIYPQLEVVDENTVKIEGVEYKKVEKEKPQTLYDALCEKDGFIVSKKTTCDIVRGWLIDHTVIETEDAERVTFTILKEQLQTPE
jgi:chromosome segregation ATPase